MILISLVAAMSLVVAEGPPMAEPVAYQTAPEVVIETGRLKGVAAGGVASFKGLPFAAPPVGDLRWRPTQPPVAWSGVRDATSVGAICIQPPSGGDPGVGPLPMSEDCLTLNVWSPTDSAEPAPVMVWIHGGGLNNGSGTAGLYDGTNLARRGVVVVTVNYRLGRLGFFDHPALAAERAQGEPSANYGLMDLIAALEWIKANISAFGGDPGNVTIFGESAGGAAVTRLMISPEAQGLFHRAAVQSGLGREEGTPLATESAAGRPSAQARSVTFAEASGLAGATAEALRATPAEVFLRPAPSFFGGDLLLIDGQLISEDVVDAFAAGRQAKVPLLIGTNSAEFWWMKPSDLSPYGAMDDGLTEAERADLLAAYDGEDGYNAHVVSDLAFNEPARHLARLHSRTGQPTWLYRFDVVSAAMPEPHAGATHASERPYVFDNLTASSWATDDMDQRAATAMADYWTAFARAGDPNGADRPVWPAARDGDTRLLDFINDGPVAKPVPNSHRLDLIERYQSRR